MLENSPLARRLRSDYEKVTRLVRESGGALRLEETRPDPPTTYVLEFNCPGLVKNQAGKIEIRQTHRVEIRLGKDYPFHMPQARLLTPTFNPHVFSSNVICLGRVWKPSETLDALILKIGALIQWDPRVLDSQSPANVEANLWAQKNRNSLPVGQVSFRGPAPAEPGRIDWQ